MRIALVLCVGLLGCLPRDNAFDRSNVDDAYDVRISAPGPAVVVHFNGLAGKGLRGYRVYREDSGGQTVLVTEVPTSVTSVADEDAAAVSAAAEARGGDATVFWRVAAVTSGGEQGPMSRRTLKASTAALPNTRVEATPDDYVTGSPSVAIQVSVTPPPSDLGPTARHFRYRFVGKEWTEPILAGPLVLTGLRDGRYTLELAAVGSDGDVDLTPVSVTFTYDFLVPDGTACDPAVCSAGLACVAEPVGRFCRRVCDPSMTGSDAGSGCPVGTACRTNSGSEGEAACVVVAPLYGRCEDSLCDDGQQCAPTTDSRRLCGFGCGTGCTGDLVCVGGDAGVCIPEAQGGELCDLAVCRENFACDNAQQDPHCRRICAQQASCGVGELCQPLNRGDSALKICQ